MAKHALSFTVAACMVASVICAADAPPPQTTLPPLTSKLYAYPAGIPYQVSPEPVGRGPQSGYNICNSTTEGPKSNCQTSFLDSINDFCLWGAPGTNQTIGDIEAASVAYCSIPGHGTRVMPPGTLTGVQFLRAPAYIQVTGTINQVNVGLQIDDGGGELDPHGADQQGNPLGGLVYTNAFPSNGGNNKTFQQVVEWNNFMGSSVFCFKACDPAVPDSAKYCDNRYDRLGCSYVSPADYTEGEFVVCDSANQDPPGVYTNSAGVVTKYTQPPESLGPITTVPYTAKIPATSNCVTYTSSLLYAAASTVPVPSGFSTVSGSSTSGSGSSTASVTPSVSVSGSVSVTVTPTSKPTSATSGTPSPSSSGAAAPRLGSVSIAANTGVLVALAVTLFGGMGAALVAL